MWSSGKSRWGKMGSTVLHSCVMIICGLFFVVYISAVYSVTLSFLTCDWTYCIKDRDVNEDIYDCICYAMSAMKSFPPKEQKGVWMTLISLSRSEITVIEEATEDAIAMPSWQTMFCISRASHIARSEIRDVCCE